MHIPNIVSHPHTQLYLHIHPHNPQPVRITKCGMVTFCACAGILLAPRCHTMSSAQAAFDRKLSHFRNEIGELRQQNIHYRPLVWTADGRPHPAVTRTLQYAPDIVSSRNDQHLSAKSLHRRWKHEIQIALLLWMAAMARAVLPNPSASAESLEPRYIS